MPTQTTATSPSVPPVLLSATPTGTAGDMSIALDFNTAMAAAGGTIIITDGAVQTVIDRATGEPTLRVVGATDTHTVSASSLVIEGSHVKLDVAGLLPGHTYSVVMGADALQSSGHVAFGGVRSTSQLTFRTPDAPDTQGPTLVSVDTDGSVLKAGGSIAVTLKFSEAVASLPADALAAPHAAIANLTTSDGGITWHATLTAPKDATTAAGNVLSLDMTKVLDAAGNHGSGTSNLASYAVDTQAPTATVTLDHVLLGGGVDAVATIKFSEAVTGLTPAALSAGHATVSNLHTTDGGTTWVATLSGTAATSAGGNVLAVDLGQVKDLAGNTGSGSVVSAAYTVDTQGPNGVAIALDGATLAAGKPVHATFTFAESVQNLSPDAIAAPHATVSNLATSDGGKTWTATLNASGTGTWTGNAVTVDLAKVVDLAGNAGSGTIASSAYTVDTQGPTATLALDGTAVHAGGSLGLTLHFSEAVKDLTTAALQTPNAALANLQHSADYLTWTATLTPQGGVTDATNAVTLDLLKVHDAAGNAGSGSAASGNYAVDTHGPGTVAIALDGATLAGNNSLHATFTFDDAVQDLPLAAISAPHAHVAGLATSDGGKTWTATLTADGNGTWTGNAIGVDLTQVKDLAGNAGSGTSTSAVYAVDTQGPAATLALDSTALHGGSSATLTIHFSEAVTDLTAAALQAPNATLANLQHSGDYLTWTATLKPQGGIEDAGNAVTLDLTKVHDALGNAGSGSATSANYIVDTQGPAATLALDSTILHNDGSATLTIRFSEAVTDLTAAALHTPNATLTNLQHSSDGLTWTATLTPQGGLTEASNTVTLDLTKVHDALGNAGSGSAVSATYTVDTVAPAVASIALDNTNLDATRGATVTIRFSEAVADLGTGAITAPHAAISGLHTADGGLTWTGTLASNDATPSSGNVLSVDLTRVHDLAGNAGSGSAQSDSYSVAGVANTLAITLDGTTLDPTHTLTATFTFTQAVRDLPLAAISAPHASMSNVATTDGGKTWTATLSASGSGDWTGNVVGVDMTKVLDVNGHAGTGNAWSSPYAVDTIGPAAPTIALGAAMLNAGGTMDVTFTFAESVSTLPATAITAPGAIVSGVHTADGGKTWMATLTAQSGVDTGDQHVMLDLAQVVDAHGNRGGGFVASTAAYSVDSKPPVVADILFDDTTLGPTHDIGFSITFSESVTGLTAAALQAPHATVSGLATADGGKTWTGTLHAEAGAGSSTGNQLRVDLTQVHDAAGNAGSGSATSLSHYSVNTDALTATVALDGTALVSGGSVGLTVRFSAAVTSLDASALGTPHAALTNLHHSDDYRTWYATLSAADTGVVDNTNAVSLDLTKVHDALGNAGSGTASSGNYTYDTTVAAYVSGIYISDQGPYENDGITNSAGEYVFGYFTGALSGTQHVKVTLDDQNIDATSVHVNSPEGGLTYWYYASEAYLPAGVHTYTARIVDDAGHASATVSKQFTIDVTAPNVTGSPDGATAFDIAGNLVLTFDKPVYWTNGESSYDGVQLYDHDGGSIYIGLTEANFSSDHKTLTLTADELHLGSGNDYTLYLPSSLTDLAGNLVTDRSIVFHTAGTYVDVTPPRATSLRADTSAGDYGVGETIGIRVTFSEPVDVRGAPALELNNGAVARFQGMSDDHRSAIFAYTVAAGDNDVSGLDIVTRGNLVDHFADGAGNVLDLAHITFGYLGDSDGYGNTIRIDTHAPDAPPAPKLAAASDTGTVGDNVTSVVAPTIAGSGAEAWAQIELYVGDRLAGSGWADGDGHWSIDNVLLGTNGTYAVKAVQYDAANNASAPSQPLTITVAGSTAAGATFVPGYDNGLSSSDAITSYAVPELTGTVAAGTTVTVWDGSTILGSDTAGSSGVWHFTPLWNLANGQHTITLELRDAAGNVTPRDLSVPFTFTVDALAPDTPAAPVLAAASDTGASSADRITNDTTPTLTGTAQEGGGQVEIYEGSSLLGKADVGSNRMWTFTLGADKALRDGDHTLTVVQVDAAGNRSASSAPLTITIDTTAPTVTTTQSTTKSGNNWHSLTFSEKIVFAQNGAINVLDSSNVGRSHHAWDVLTNWDIATDGRTLELNLGTLKGAYHLAMDGNAIQDVAGNVAIIGSTDFTLAPTA
ncbi:Ig-like domain-containing protein [Massilia sp. PDC64]|nr:Ig-like domain-containing protein [Massilia sp. PDC64]SDF58610.1 Ig-like domain-containing protein [Massilia sp. PDC64]